MNLLKKEFRKLMTRSGFVFLCRVSGAAIVFLTQIMMARWINATELGIYIYAFSLAMLLSTISAIGLPAASLRFISQYLANEKMDFINGFIIKGHQIILISCLCVGAITFSILNIFSGSSSIYYMPVLISILCIPFISITRFYDRVAHAFSLFGLGFFPSMTLRPLLFLITLYLMFEYGYRLSAETSMIVQFSAIAAVTIIQSIILFFKLKQKINCRIKSYDSFLWIRISIPLLIITIFTQYFTELSIVLIDKDLNPDQVAIYNASYRVSLLIGFVYNSINAAIVPKASRLYAQGDVAGLQNYITHATRLNFLLSVIGFIAFVFAGEFLLSLFGEKFIIGYPALIILSMTQLFQSGIGPGAILLNITGHQNKCLSVFGLSIILSIVLENYLVPQLNIVGAAIMVFIVVVFWSLCLHFLVKRHLKIHSSIFSFLVKS